MNYKPIRGLQISASYDIAQRGGYVYMKDDAITYPLSKNLTYNQTNIEINASYRLLTNAQAFIGYSYSQHSGDVQYIPQLFAGKTNTVLVGLNVGF